MKIDVKSTEQDKDAKTTYPFEILAWLNSATIASFVVTTVMEVVKTSKTDDTMFVTLAKGAGIVGQPNLVNIHVVASDGQEDDIEFYILLK